MLLDEQTKLHCAELLVVIDSIEKQLVTNGHSVSGYEGLRRAKNILKNNDPSGIKNIGRHISSDFRMIFDNRAYDPEIEKLMDDAYSIVERI